jgi:hypothetical protein
MTLTTTLALLTADDLATVAQQAKDSTVNGLTNLLGAPRLGELDDRTWYDAQVTPVLMDELHHRAVLENEARSIRPITKYAAGDQVYWGSMFCTVASVNATATPPTYLLTREVGGETLVSARSAGEHELYPAVVDNHRTGCVPYLATASICSELKCGLTGTDKCPDNYEESEVCPTC